MASVTVTSTTTKISPNIHFDSSYIKTRSGILKIAEAVVSLIAFICVQASYYFKHHSSNGWFSFVSMCAFWVTLILLILYLFHIIERLHFIPWLLAELGFCALWAIFFFIAAAVACSNAPIDGSWGAAAFFGFVAMALFAFDAFDKFKAWRGGGIAQGERTSTSATTTNANSPSYPAY